MAIRSFLRCDWGVRQLLCRSATSQLARLDYCHVHTCAICGAVAYELISIERTRTVNSRLLTLLVVLPLSACMTTGYRSVLLDADFEAGARTLEAVAPVERDTASAFNVPLGSYTVENVAVGDARVVYSVRNFGLTESEVSVDNAGWIELTEQALAGSRSEQAPYRTEDESTLSFSLAHPSGVRVETACVVNNVGMEPDAETRARSSSAGGLGRPIEYDQWLATRVICTVRDGEQTWFLRSAQRLDGPPSIELYQGGTALEVSVLPEGVAKKPFVGGTAAKAIRTRATGKTLPGVSIANAGTSLAAVSMFDDNSAIWLAEQASQVDEPLLVASAYALILRSWLGNS